MIRATPQCQSGTKLALASFREPVAQPQMLRCSRKLAGMTSWTLPTFLSVQFLHLKLLLSAILVILECSLDSSRTGLRE